MDPKESKLVNSLRNMYKIRVVDLKIFLEKKEFSKNDVIYYKNRLESIDLSFCQLINNWQKNFEDVQKKEREVAKLRRELSEAREELSEAREELSEARAQNDTLREKMDALLLQCHGTNQKLVTAEKVEYSDQGIQGQVQFQLLESSSSLPDKEMAERHDGKVILSLSRDLVLQLQTLIENK